MKRARIFIPAFCSLGFSIESGLGQTLDGGLEFEFGQLIRSIPSVNWEDELPLSKTQRDAISRIKAMPDAEQRLLDAIDVVKSQPMGDYLLIQGAINGLNRLDNLSDKAIDHCRTLLEGEKNKFGTYVYYGKIKPSWLGGAPRNDQLKAQMEIRWITMKKCMELLATRGDRSDLKRIEFFAKIEGHPGLAKDAMRHYDRLLTRLSEFEAEQGGAQ